MRYPDETFRIDLSRVDVHPSLPVELYRVHLELREAGFWSITEESGCTVRSWYRNPVFGWQPSAVLGYSGPRAVIYY